MRELGLFGATIGRDHGGLGLSALTYARIVGRIAAVWMSITGVFNAHLIMSAIVERFGTEAQKKEFLPRFATGELRGGLALTEPDAGTDLQGIRTRAEREGNANYVINGAKMWTTNGVHGTCFAVLVKTDPKAQPRHARHGDVSCREGPGFRGVRPAAQARYKSIDTAELSFQDYRIPADRLIGERGPRFSAGCRRLELGRINVAARGVGIATAALNDSVAYAQVRKTFGKPICQHQAIQLKLADMATRVEAGRLLTEQAAARVRCRRAL